MNRRDFLRNTSSLLLIPAYVKAESLMKIVALPGIYLPNGELYLGGHIDVRWFGARHDLDDNTLPFQKAADFASKYLGRADHIFIPAEQLPNPNGPSSQGAWAIGISNSNYYLESRIIELRKS